MLNKIFSIYDSKAAAYKSFFVMPRRDEAMRAFGTICNDDKSDICNHAEDYSMFELGEVDLETGIVSPYAVPLLIQTAITASSVHRDYYAKLQIEALSAA